MNKPQHYVDSTLWQIHPHFLEQAQAILGQVQAEGLSRDALERRFTQSIARYLELDELPIDMLGDGIALVTVTGVLIKPFNYYTASYRALTAAFERLTASNDVRAVVVKFDTPGGTCDGLHTCAAALETLAEKKLTVAQIDGGCYSAGYQLACNCGTICCGETDQVGNIGTVLSIADFSGLYQKSGVRQLVFRTGEIKGIGIPGAPVTPPQETFLQQLVDEHFAYFREAVINGRGMTDEQFAAVSDGSFWLGATALGLGIVDSISTLDQTVQAIRSQLMAA